MCQFTIFLDIDGVLNCAKDWKYPFTLNKECISNFISMTSGYSCNIILISSWSNGFIGRKNPDNGIYIKELEKYITINGKIKNHQKREQCILEYIKEYGIHDYIVIDDEKEHYSVCDNLYIVDGNMGFTKRDVIKCRRIISNVQ